jgi:hypothetical protein
MRRLCCCSGCTEKETRHDTKAGAGASEIAWRERNCTIRVQYSSSNTACSIRFPDRFEYDKSKNAVFECSIRTIRSGSNGYFIEYSIRCRIRMQYSNDKKWPKTEIPTFKTVQLKQAGASPRAAPQVRPRPSARLTRTWSSSPCQMLTWQALPGLRVTMSTEIITCHLSGPLEGVIS